MRCDDRDDRGIFDFERAGIRALDFDSFFELFGRGGSPRAREAYATLREALPAASREHWDREIRLFEPDRVRGRSFYYRGSSGLVALALTRWIRHGAPGSGPPSSGCSPPARSASSSGSTTTSFAADCSARGCCASSAARR